MWKGILKGEEIHPSVKGFETKAKAIYARLRKDMIKFQKEIEEIEKLIDTDVWEKTPKTVQDRLLNTIKDYKVVIERNGKIIGSKFNPKHPKYESTVNQRLTPTTKKPKVKRMKRPVDEISYDPNEKDMDKAVMRRFGITEEDWKEMPFETKKTLISAYYKTKD